MQKLPMWDKQKEALLRIRRRIRKGITGTCLFAKMGTGKTRIVVHLLEWLFVHEDVRLVYVVGPLSALHVWIENWHDWAQAPVAFIDLHETGSAGIREARRLAKGGFPIICLVNYEAAWQIGYKRVKRVRHGEEVIVLEKVDTALSDISWDVGILDESTSIKTPGSKVSRFFRTKVAKRTTYRIPMTGSAYTKRPLDVWAQVRFALPETKLFPSTFAAFKVMYTIPHPHIRGAIVGYQNLDDLAWRLSKCAILLNKEDVLDLPPAVHTTRLVELSAKSRKLYDELKEELVAELEAIEVRKSEYKDLEARLESLDEDSEEFAKIADRMEELKAEGPVTITAEHIFTRITKLLQICSGFVYPDPTEIDEKGRPIRPPAVRLGHEKLDVLMELLDARAGEPTVVVTQMDEEEKIISEAVAKRLGFKPKILNGSVQSAENRYNMIAAAANDPVFIVKQSVGARGVDMRWADTIIFYSHNFNTEFYEQMLARNHRGGQTKSVTYVHILCRRSMDMKVMLVLEKDLDLARSIERNWREFVE